MLRPAPGLAAPCLALCILSACVAPPALAPPTVAIEASEALYEGHAALQARPERRAAARAACERAVALAPDWVAPRRLLDDIARMQLRGVEALESRRAALAQDVSDARALYLAGRLEGREGRRRFENAVRFDPDLAWGWHGLAIAAANDGRPNEAVAHMQVALRRALDPWERTFFQSVLARQLAAAGRAEDALEFLDECASAQDLAERNRTALLLVSVEIGLDVLQNRTRERAYERGLEILRDRDVADADLESIVPRMRRSLYVGDVDGAQLALALACKSGPVRERLRADVITSPSSRAVIERALAREGREPPAGARARATRFGQVDVPQAIETWRASLPKVVTDADGLPKDPQLANIVRLSRQLAPRATPDAVFDFGLALVEAGWFREARHVASRLATADLDLALALENRALAGQTIIDGLDRIARRSDRQPPAQGVRDEEGSEASRRVSSLEEFLAALAPVFARANRFLGGETDGEKLREVIEDSPRSNHVGLAELVHPGPRFSAADEREGLGQEGETVGGVAALFARIRRFAIIGEVVGGGGPDACVLPKLWEEWRSGEHLGVKWQGTVVYCEAADLKSRAGRQGAMISAAALHEGYWIDIDAVRDEHAIWTGLRRRFANAAGVTDADRRLILAATGLRLDARATERERLSTAALLGEASRVRLAVLMDNGKVEGELGQVTLDDVIEATALHEQGHLCDRTRFVPLLDHKLAVLGFIIQCQFSPQRITEELEYRAQLVCLCAAPDPRIPLAQLLDAAEGGTNSSLTPHSAGYKRLLDDLLRVLDEGSASEPSVFPTLDRSLTLAHQFHRLSVDDIRRAALRLAARKGL
jgi:tetratricopeptide (TPR) repeat protein